MARRGGRGMGLGPMALVVSVIVGLIIAVALYSFAPVVGYQIAQSTTIPYSSAWNSGITNMSATNASAIWTTTSGLPIIMIIAIVIGSAIAIFMGI